MKTSYYAQALVLAAIAATSTGASADCVCRCTGGRVVPLCTSTLDIAPICTPTICPIETPSIAPIAAPQLNPLGTSSCSQRQVFNPSTGRYEWQRICY